MNTFLSLATLTLKRALSAAKKHIFLNLSDAKKGIKEFFFIIFQKKFGY